jgi:hypothetical protein
MAKPNLLIHIVGGTILFLHTLVHGNIYAIFVGSNLGNVQSLGHSFREMGSLHTIVPLIHPP